MTSSGASTGAQSKYQGGGVVIRYIVEPLTGKWATVYYPAHRIQSVTVTPKSQ